MYTTFNTKNNFFSFGGKWKWHSGKCFSLHLYFTCPNGQVVIKNLCTCSTLVVGIILWTFTTGRLCSWKFIHAYMYLQVTYIHCIHTSIMQLHAMLTWEVYCSVYNLSHYWCTHCGASLFPLSRVQNWRAPCLRVGHAQCSVWRLQSGLRAEVHSKGAGLISERWPADVSQAPYCEWFLNSIIATSMVSFLVYKRYILYSVCM